MRPVASGLSFGDTAGGVSRLRTAARYRRLLPGPSIIAEENGTIIHAAGDGPGKSYPEVFDEVLDVVADYFPIAYSNRYEGRILGNPRSRLDSNNQDVAVRRISTNDCSPPSRPIATAAKFASARPIRPDILSR